MTTLAILRGALATLDQAGWHQGSSTCRETHRGCLLWALYRQSQDWHACYLAEQVLRPLAGPNLIAWNDTPGRTYAEVRALLTAGIAIAEQEEDSIAERLCWAGQERGNQQLSGV